MKIIFLVGHISLYAVFFQRVQNFKGGCLGRAVQNHNIPKFNGAISFAVAHKFFRRNQLMNFPRDKSHFNFNILAVVVALSFYVKKFGAFVKIIRARLVARAELQLRRCVVVNFRRLLIHQPLKNFIHRADNFFPTAEIFRQVDTAIRIHFIFEVRRIDEAETINRLLNVADTKNIVAARNFLDNRLLHAVCILIFVNHDEFKFVAIGGGDFGRVVENL